MSSFQQKLALKGSETSIEHFAAVLKDVKDRGGWNTASALVRPFLLLLIRQRNAQTQYRPHLQLLLIHLDCKFSCSLIISIDLNTDNTHGPRGMYFLVHPLV